MEFVIRGIRCINQASREPGDHSEIYLFISVLKFPFPFPVNTFRYPYEGEVEVPKGQEATFDDEKAIVFDPKQGESVQIQLWEEDVNPDDHQGFLDITGELITKLLKEHDGEHLVSFTPFGKDDGDFQLLIDVGKMVTVELREVHCIAPSSGGGVNAAKKFLDVGAKIASNVSEVAADQPQPKVQAVAAVTKLVGGLLDTIAGLCNGDKNTEQIFLTVQNSPNTSTFDLRIWPSKTAVEGHEIRRSETVKLGPPYPQFDVPLGESFQLWIVSYSGGNVIGNCMVTTLPMGGEKKPTDGKIEAVPREFTIAQPEEEAGLYVIYYTLELKR
ncbi:MAG: hypothetical protein AAGG51_25790 [Cyanobacteria bacterium P01_G01_bin.54]